MDWASYGPSQAFLMNILLWLARTGPVQARTVGEARVACHDQTTGATTKPVLAQNWHVYWARTIGGINLKLRMVVKV